MNARETRQYYTNKDKNIKNSVKNPHKHAKTEKSTQNHAYTNINTQNDVKIVEKHQNAMRYERRPCSV